jgi:hypothetical protein
MCRRTMWESASFCKAPKLLDDTFDRNGLDPSDKRLWAGETVTQLCLGHVALQGSAVAVTVEQRQ